MQCPTFTNVYWDLNIKKFVPPMWGPCHGITGILVNPAMTLPGKTKIAQKRPSAYCSAFC